MDTSWRAVPVGVQRLTIHWPGECYNEVLWMSTWTFSPSLGMERLPALAGGEVDWEPGLHMSGFRHWRLTWPGARLSLSLKPACFTALTAVLHQHRIIVRTYWRMTLRQAHNTADFVCRTNLWGGILFTLYGRGNRSLEKLSNRLTFPTQLMGGGARTPYQGLARWETSGSQLYTSPTTHGPFRLTAFWCSTSSHW